MDVSCKPISGLVAFLETKIIDPQLVLQGKGATDSVTREDLSGGDSLLSWEQLTAVLSRAETLLDGNGQVDELTKFLMTDQGLLMSSFSSIIKNIMSPAMLYEIVINLFGSRYFPTAGIKYDLTQAQYRLSIEIPDPNVHAEFFFKLIQNVLEFLPEKIGCRHSFVTAEISACQCIYTIIPPVGINSLHRIWRRIKAMFITGKIIRELIVLESSIERKHARLLGTNRQLAKHLDSRNLEVERILAELNGKIKELKEVEVISDTGTLSIFTETNQVLLSDNAAKIFNLAEDRSLTFDRLESLLHPEDQKEFSIAISRLSFLQPDINFEFRIVAGENYRNLLLRGRLVNHNNKKAIFSSIFDVTNLRQNELRLAKEREEALEASRNKNQFLASMSHEIRTHMTSVLGFAELIKNPKSSPQNYGSYVDTILRNGKHMLHIIDNILDLSKVEAGQLRFNRTQIDTRQLLTDSLEPIKVLAQKKDINFEIHFSSSMPEQLITDTTRFLQVINYVLTNAVKYTSHGTITLAIKPSVSPNNNSGIAITFEDTGSGLSSEFNLLLFSPYSAFAMENKKKNSVAGLELALARALTVAMEGGIQPSPNINGVGTRFAIVMHSIPGTEEAAALTVENFSMPIDQLGSGPLLKSRKILITEDNKDIQQIIKKTVEDAGAVTEVANNGLECLAMVKKTDFDIILMDLQMPLMDGFEAIERLRAGGFKRPIIVVTAYALNNERERCIKVGCTDFVSKPINSATLLKTLARHQTPL